MWCLHCNVLLNFSHLVIIIHNDVIKWKIFSHYWPFVRGIHRSPVNSPHKGQWRGAFIFSLICAWINAWVNNRKAGDLGLHRAHYDVTIMSYKTGGYILWRLNVFALNYKRCNYVWGILGYKAEVKKRLIDQRILWRHQMAMFSVLLALCERNTSVTGGFSHKGQWCGALFSLICAWTNV